MDARSSSGDDVVNVHDITGQRAHKISLQLRCQFEAPLALTTGDRWRLAWGQRA